MKCYHVYILKCADNSYYTVITSDLDKRISEHESGTHKNSYTHFRRPVKLVYSAEFSSVDLAIAMEKKIKKWSRVKKEALITGAFEHLPNLSIKNFKKQ